MNNDSRVKARRYLLLGLLIAIQILNGFLNNRMRTATISLWGQTIMVNSILGCLTMVQLMICTAITANEWLIGSIISYCSLGISLVSVSMGVFVGKNVNALPGFLMVVFGMCFVTVFRNRLKLIEANNRFYQNISVTDSLTGLTNRRGMRDFVAGLIQSKTPFYLLFMDLDNFKYVNDTIGHGVGDIILDTVAKRCSEVDNPNGLVARNGGDEFIVVIPEYKGLNIERKAQQYLNMIGRELWIEKAHLHYNISASMGVSHYPEHSTEMDDIINYADTAMYDAKNSGKNRVSMFNMSMAEKSIHDKQMEKVIEEGLERKRFFLMYQPQYKTKTQELRGFEALIRLKNKDGGIVSPSDFIPVAEQSDLILEIDKYVLKYAMNQFADIARRSQNGFIISINISAKHISDRSFPDIVKQVLEETGFPAKCLEIEITEYCMVRDTASATYTIKELNKMGIAIALDDFGTGYASLSNLTKLPIDLLKIDKSFVDNLSMNKTNNEFVEAIISMGHLMHCDIISEGVETQEQLNILAESQCDYVQGYIWSRPLSYEAAIEVVKEKVKLDD